MQDPRSLRKLAAWYREYAERAGNPWVWEARLKRADDLERQAAGLEIERADGDHTLAVTHR